MSIWTMLGVNQSELDEAIHALPTPPGRLLSSPMWKVKNLSTTTVSLEYVEGKINLIPARSRQDSSNIKTFGKNGVLRSFSVPHLPLTTTIQAAQIQDVRQWGSADAMLNNAEVVMQEVQEHQIHHQATLEHLMLGAIKGKIMDADGSTEIYNLFNEFGISEPTLSLPTNTTTTDLGASIEQMVRKMKKALRGDVAQGVTVLCSPEFFDALTGHKSAKEAWQRYQDNVLARENSGGKFAWKGAVFEIYDYSLGGAPMIEAGHAHAFLEGTQRAFTLYYAPANLFNEANKIARPFYVDIAELEHKRGVSIYTESNPLPLCLQPQSLMHLSTS